MVTRFHQMRWFSGSLAFLLITSGVLRAVLPSLAQTAAGTPINNQATGTYEDPANPGIPIGTQSNTVTVTVAEVAGITVTGGGVTDTTPGTPVSPGDLLRYDFVVTNVGNDPTRFRIPNTAAISGPATIAGNLQVSFDGGTTFTDIVGTELITPDTAAGLIQPGRSVIVRVNVTVNPTAAITDPPIVVRFGQTPGDAQNQPRIADGGDVYTVDGTAAGATPIAEVPGAPVNGDREASATQSIPVGSNPQALAAILKTSSVNNQGTPPINDDVINYNLTLRVQNTPPPGSTNITPAPLQGTGPINGLPAGNYVLISDAIPVGTDLAGPATVSPALAAAGWQPVYTTDPLTTNANVATWTLTAPGTFPAAAVTRVGFVLNTDVRGVIPAGTTLSGFSFPVSPEAAFVIAGGGNIDNIAQLFGRTAGTNNQVYDESGDQNPSNYNDDGTPGSQVPTDGVAIPGNGTDPGGNTGTGPGGENNRVNLTPPAGVLNGPQGQPAAVGPTSNNDDFTNKAAPVPPGSGTGPIDPPIVTFTNTVQNTAPVSTALTIVPGPVAPGSLPAGTVVTVTYAGQSATYTYNAGGVPTLTSGTPVVIPAADLPAGGTRDYGVVIDLPANTPQLTGFTVPLIAFNDQNADQQPTVGEPQNITINRVYTGFVRLVKESRILRGTGPAVVPGNEVFSTAPKVSSPGNIIEYRITYTNISEPQTGSNTNLVLQATNLRIVENGTQPPSNWAIDQDPPGSPGFGIIDTSNVVGTAVDDPGTGSTITFFTGATGTTPSGDISGQTQDTDVTAYINTITGPIGPGVSRRFFFQRRVN
ncbi:MAG: hypothetical protein NZ772_02010 [Cyanobacteria bacterium]|nr:hypothetical protein [Cyanobacteriota bacterium]MDW8202201.1 hypothetical protein [Cyanobacteriota bacterium SKYGB_h_bin112]